MRVKSGEIIRVFGEISTNILVTKMCTSKTILHKMKESFTMKNDDNIAWCPHWQPGRGIKKCNWCLDLEKKLELALSVLRLVKDYLSKEKEKGK